ncbi:MAG: GNAT family N-acetyltransferase [Deltaproteobacteria bacterium]|nr:GNAT family N-acetyltransferase [Deltaproteobacteria bacterium]
MKLFITEENPKNPDACLLLEELSEALTTITGHSGKSSFHVNDLHRRNSFFLMARNKNNTAIGCGSVREIEHKIGEIKRMYAKYPGIGKYILAELEIKAKQLGYEVLRLETRKINTKAIHFYLRNGYKVIPNYGRYIGNKNAICFQKNLPLPLGSV